MFAFLVAVSPATQIYVSSRGDGTIQRFDTSGNYLGVFASGLAGPIGISWNNNNLFVADYNAGIIRRFGQGGSSLGTFAAPISSPLGMLWAGGNLYVSTQGSTTAYTQEFNSTGTLLNTINSNMARTDQMALGPDGNIYVSSFIDHKVEKLSLAGADLGSFATFGTAGITSVVAATFDSAGNFYTSNTFTGKIYKLSPTGVPLLSFNNPGLPGAAGGALEFMTYHGGNTLYEVDSFSNNVRKFDTSGNDLGDLINTHLNQPYEMVFGPDAQAAPEPQVLGFLGVALAALVRRRKR